uniref:Uncharacterized protein n=1 Tax=Anguilla anguilla TaxID=7936 RepID=A0A0E9UDP5_ANGAN
MYTYFVSVLLHALLLFKNATCTSIYMFYMCNVPLGYAY